MLLLIDNYDSFAFNLARYFERLGQLVHVVRNDQIDVEGVAAAGPSAVILSPGPCTPNEAGCCLELVRELHTMIPMLGICLGHQVIAAALGGKVVRAAEPVHGRASEILHHEEGIFAGLPSPLSGCRYHSLVVERETLPASLAVTAWTSDGTIMALEHRSLPVVGIQFHPESILTDGGYPLLAAFLQRAGVELLHKLPTLADERAASTIVEYQTPLRPVTF